ncbi:Ankyrin repeat domain-containing protein 50 [Acropora cervicornis]|uniref:Ankyrin repeat domain-containing protein 50 n=1 Tax=Acropora cervicornis TaxID=6130 RepID=A0AAD9Q6B9_ACRCE|nr:Ankyrin repeat domain-containing protein 50 [Acropora cervicornis]
MAGPHSASLNWQSKILKKEYQNWLCVGHALSLMLDGLRPYIEKEMKIFHQRLLTNLSSAPPCICPNPMNHKRTCAWSKYLIGCHRAGKPKWHQSDPKKWSDIDCGHWEIAKLFMADLGTSKAVVVDASTTDCTGLINLISWCDHFQVQIHLINDVREVRNTKWGHAPKQELTDCQKSSALNAIRKLLQDPELVTDADAQKALHQINCMEKELDVRSVERKVLADFQLAVFNQLGELTEEIQKMKKMQKRSLKLEKQVNRFEILYQDVKGRIEEMEQRNTPHTTWNSIGRSLDKSLQILAGNVNSLYTKSVLHWSILLIILTCFTCLDHKSYNDGCPMENGDVPFDTKEFNFTSQLNVAREGFTGRQWLYHNLESLLLNSEEDSVPGVVVVGEPGAGKSALSAQLICSRSSNPFIHKRIIGYHLCKHSDKATQDPGRFVRNLVDLIARRVPQYGMLIYNSSFISRILERNCLRDPLDCFEQAVVVPLHQLKDEIQNYFVVVDALDECSDTGDSGTSMVSFLKDSYAKLPRWIHLILTSRNDSSVLRHFSRFPKLHLSSTDSKNLQDIEIFITTKTFENPSLIELLKFKLGFGNRDAVSNLTNKLLHQSQGNFLFAKEMLRYLREDPQGVDLNKLPNTIDEQYESYLKRAFGSREKFKSALAVLEVLVSSFETLTTDRLFDVLSIREKIDYEYDFVYTLKALSHFITYGRDNTISLFHLSFQEWLTSQENLGNPYYVSRSHGHIRLSEYYMTLVTENPNSSEDIYRLAQHITFDKKGEQFFDQFRAINASFINNTTDNENRTLLHLAANNKNAKVLKLLRSLFHDIDCEDKYGFTPAFVAGMNGLLENVDFLIRQGADTEHRTKPPPPPPPPPNSFLWDPIEKSKTAFWNSTMMHAAAAGGYSKVVLLLLERNASFTRLNAVNLTAIELAAENGHLEVVKILYERGARLHHLSLQHAAFNGHTDVVEFIQSVGVADRCMRCDGSFSWLGNKTRYQTASSDSIDYILFDDRFKILCQSALHLAVAKNHTKVVNQLLRQDNRTNHCIDFTGRTPLHEAVRQNHVGIAQLLIEHGARIPRKCSFFQNISISDGCLNRNNYNLSKIERLEYEKDLCHCGSTPFLLAARYGHIDVANLLLRHGARPDMMDCFGATPLHVAACHGHYMFIDWLIRRRPMSFKINHRSKNQSTLLHSAAICHNNKNIEPLISRGAKIDVIDNDSMTPLHYSALNAVKMDEITIFKTTINPSLDISVWRKVPLHVQCLKLIEITKSTHAFLISKADKKGRTALHLAAQNGDECQTTHLLLKGARTDLTDRDGRTPLDIAIDSAHDDFYTRKRCMPLFHCMDEEAFDVRQAINMRSHTAVADILLNEEASLTHTCDGRQTSLLHRAFENEKPFIADRLLSKGALLSCRDKEGRTPLLIYLQNGGTWLDVVLNRHDVNISIECGKPFNFSEFHLAAFRKPTNFWDNFLERRFSEDFQSFIEDGPLAKAIKVHPRGFRIIDECRDAEGYTALHRAAQGGNLIALKWFLFRGADPTVLTSQGHSALTLAIASGINPYSSSQKREAAEKTSAVLLNAMTKISPFGLSCNIGDAKLTIYHLAAYAGLSGLVKTLLNSKLVHGIDVNCSNVHGITPLYLAKLNIVTDDHSDGKSDPWHEIAHLIEKRGGVLTYPNRKAELHLLYKHLFGSFLDPFRLNTLNSKSEWFYESDVTHCTASDFDYYKAQGTTINPHLAEKYKELKRLIKSLTVKSANNHLVPRELHQLQSSLTVIREIKKANSELWQANEEVLSGIQRIQNEAARRRTQARSPKAATVKIPKMMRTKDNLTKFFISAGNDLVSLEQNSRELRFKYDSLNTIQTQENKHIQKILYKYKHVFKDAKKMLDVLEKYEESNLCMEEISQAMMINSNFITYVLRSRTNDFFSFWRCSLPEGEFASERIPTEWISTFNPKDKDIWNQPVKFLYQQGTQRFDSSFNYLQVLSLGCDKDTRVPLSVEVFRLD